MSNSKLNINKVDFDNPNKGMMWEFNLMRTDNRLPNEQIQLLNIDQVVRSKMGSKARFMPRWVTAWLEHFIHQKQINACLADGCLGVDFCKDALRHLDAKVELFGVQNLPSKMDGKRYTFVSNHPLGGLDGLSLGAVIGDIYDGEIKYLVNDLLMNLQGLAPLCAPVSLVGHKSRKGSAALIEAFEGKEHIVMFPAALCSRMIDGRVQDLPWKKTFISKSVATQRDVVPIFFEGQNSKRFYRVAKLCKLLHLKFNAAMLLLPDEMFRNCHHTFKVYVGEPIPWQTFDHTKTDAQWAQWVRNQVYELKKLFA